MREMIDKLKEASKEYYKGNPIMTDYEYDQLYDYLVELEKETGIIYSDSPTQNVGTEPVDEISKVRHDHLMLSLDKVHTSNEIKEFGHHDIVAMYKADGLTISATYEDGELTKLETRGNGEIGNDILFHAKSFLNLPLRINKKGKYVIDGECVIKWDDFEKLKEKNNEYKHPRNLAAGSLNVLDPNISKERCLRFYAWDVIEGSSYTLLCKNLYEAKELGFETVCFFTISKEDIENYNLDDFLSYMKKLAFEEKFPIDGLVFKYNNIPYGRSLGATDHHPRSAIAYKYEDVTYPTTVREIDWTVGKTGVIVPTVVVDPVDVDGVIVERASLHNVSIFKQLSPSKGATAFIYRANGVVPQVDRFESNSNDEFNIPDTCPVCGGKTEIVKTDNTEILTCTNPSCKGKLLGKLNTFVSKKGLDIRGLSEQSLAKFIELGWINSFSDIFTLSTYKSRLIKLDGFGEKSVNKLLKSIDESKSNVDPKNFIVALSIPGIGEGQAKTIIKVYKTFDNFISRIKKGKRIDIEGIGDVLNNNIFNWYNTTYTDDNIDELLKLISFKETESVSSNNNLSHMTFVITGSVNKFKNRKELEEFITNHGGKVSGSVSKNTNYLINNDSTSTSSKNMKARELGIPIITEDEFISMIEGFNNER